jgi:rare lipoprotein A
VSFPRQQDTGRAPRILFWAGMLIATAMTCGCSLTSHPSPVPVYSAPLTGGSSPRVVTASWYGREFRGRRTSNGEIFNPDGLTAASRTLPMGSRVAVTNISNGRTVVVRINDRGPFVKGRGLDLSRAAAQRIGLTRKGTGRVEVTRADGVRADHSRVTPVSHASILPWHPPATRSRHGRLQRTRHRRLTNPIGRWIVSALPHF